MRSSCRSDEGQTSVDFLIGASIFATTLLFVLQLATGSVVNTVPDSRTEDALADRSAAIAISNWSVEDGDGNISNDSAKDFLDRGYDEVGNDLNFPRVNGELKYRYNITVSTIENMSAEPAIPINESGVDLTAGNSTNVSTRGMAGVERVAYMQRPDGSGEMVAVRVKVW